MERSCLSEDEQDTSSELAQDLILMESRNLKKVVEMIRYYGQGH